MMNSDHIKEMIDILNKPQVLNLLSDRDFVNIFLKGKKENLNENQLQRINHIIQNKELMSKISQLYSVSHKYFE